MVDAGDVVFAAEALDDAAESLDDAAEAEFCACVADCPARVALLLAALAELDACEADCAAALALLCTRLAVCSMPCIFWNAASSCWPLSGLS